MRPHIDLHAIKAAVSKHMLPVVKRDLCSLQGWTCLWTVELLAHFMHVAIAADSLLKLTYRLVEELAPMTLVLLQRGSVSLHAYHLSAGPSFRVLSMRRAFIAKLIVPQSMH